MLFYLVRFVLGLCEIKPCWFLYSFKQAKQKPRIVAKNDFYSKPLKERFIITKFQNDKWWNEQLMA